ncbi:hypothetical protein ABZX30_32960 [Streptomyces sp. NPDC004542]|uniref:hypothetical protein n=1 Tax=Streptomyces sp. NPDC004542 TaxID=3154281 RepID=UPI0033B6F34B
MFQLGRGDAENAHPDLDTGVDQGDRPEAGPCTVFISGDGTVTVDGEVIATATSGDAAQTVVLDRLHQRALDRAAPVEASVLDQQRRMVLRIRVREDGASELLEDPRPLEDPKPLDVATTTALGPSHVTVTPAPSPPADAPAVPTAASAPEAAGAGTGSRPGGDTRNGASGDDDTAVPTAFAMPAQSPPLPAIHTPTPSVSASAEPVAVPEELVTAVTLVCETVTSGELTLAKVQAAALERQAAHHFGPDHLYTLEARALEAHVAHLMGDHATATTLSLQVAALRHRQGDARAREDIERALASWELLATPFTAIPLGRRLLSLWDQIAGAAGTERYAAAEQRLSTLTRVTPPAFAASMASIL